MLFLRAIVRREVSDCVRTPVEGAVAITNGLKAICLLFVFLMDGDERTIIAAADELLNRIME